MMQDRDAMKKIIDYIRKFNHRLVSPIWEGNAAVRFLCMGHLDIAHALGFELEQVTPVLKIVKEGQLKDKAQLDQLIQNHQFNFEQLKDEIQRLYYLREKFPDSLHGGGCFGPLTVVSDILFPFRSYV